jgi:hypothetical protein
MDRTSWISAVQAANASAQVITEDFEGATLQPGLTQTGGSIALQIGGSGNNHVLVGAGLPSIFKLQPPNPLHALTFDPLITAMGGDWDLSIGGTGRGLELDLVFHLGGGTQQQQVFISNPLDMTTQTYTPFKGFFGFVADQPFQTVIYWSADFTGDPESFALDNLSFVQSSERARKFPTYRFKFVRKSR